MHARSRTPPLCVVSKKTACSLAWLINHAWFIFQPTGPHRGLQPQSGSKTAWITKAVKLHSEYKPFKGMILVLASARSRWTTLRKPGEVRWGLLMRLRVSLLQSLYCSGQRPDNASILQFPSVTAVKQLLKHIYGNRLAH